MMNEERLRMRQASFQIQAITINWTLDNFERLIGKNPQVEMMDKFGKLLEGYELFVFSIGFAVGYMSKKEGDKDE